VKKGYAVAAVVIILLVAVYMVYRNAVSTKTPQALGPEEIGEPSETLPQTRQVDLYFADAAGRRLSLERREVKGENREDLLKKVIEELVRGPADSGRMRTLPETSQVRTVYYRSGTVWVDLSASLRDLP
jgi:hypothetical protein